MRSKRTSRYREQHDSTEEETKEGGDSLGNIYAAMFAPKKP